MNSNIGPCARITVLTQQFPRDAYQAAGSDRPDPFSRRAVQATATPAGLRFTLGGMHAMGEEWALFHCCAEVVVTRGLVSSSTRLDVLPRIVQ